MPDIILSYSSHRGMKASLEAFSSSSGDVCVAAMMRNGPQVRGRKLTFEVSNLRLLHWTTRLIWHRPENTNWLSDSIEIDRPVRAGGTFWYYSLYRNTPNSMPHI